jgi:glycosyltransferase involved in cell wall biosynthesis
MMLSVVIPNYNGSRTLLDTIRCVLDQIPADSEVLMVDDFSTDRSVELVKTNYPIVRIIKNSHNLGAGSARNIGIKQSTGDFVLFVDADVLLEPGCIASLLDAAQTSDIAFPQICYANGQAMYPVDEVQASYLMISPVFLVRRNSLHRVVPSTFDEIYRTYCEDTDFFLRAYLAGLVSCYLPGAKAIHNVDLQPRNRELRYFLEMRNSIYGAIKFFGVAGIDHFDHAFHLGNILKLFVCGLFNFNLFDMQARGYRKYGDVKHNLTLLIKKHDPLTERGGLALVGILVKALFWNLKNLSRSLTANAEIAKQFSKAARKPE